MKTILDGILKRIQPSNQELLGVAYDPIKQYYYKTVEGHPGAPTKAAPQKSNIY